MLARLTAIVHALGGTSTTTGRRDMLTHGGVVAPQGGVVNKLNTMGIVAEISYLLTAALIWARSGALLRHKNLRRRALHLQYPLVPRPIHQEPKTFARRDELFTCHRESFFAKQNWQSQNSKESRQLRRYTRNQTTRHFSNPCPGLASCSSPLSHAFAAAAVRKFRRRCGLGLCRIHLPR